MPEYEYHCEPCDKTFSIVRSMNESFDESVSCNDCGGSNTNRIWGAFVATGRKSQSAGGKAQSEVCASNPSMPKSCCPCGP